jgi:hypothetical protein
MMSAPGALTCIKRRSFSGDGPRNELIQIKAKVPVFYLVGAAAASLSWPPN